MKKACLVVDPIYQKNEIFNSQSWLNRDDCLAFFHELKVEFLKIEIDLQTNDLISPESADIVIYNEIPKHLPIASQQKKSHLLLFESELIRSDNWNLDSHRHFNKIFTWNDDLVDQKKYLKFNFTHGARTQFLDFAKKEHFCTLIAGAKSVKHPLELYSQRVEAIRWFEKNHPDQFEFYGMGWDMHTFKLPIVSRILNRIKPLRRLLAQPWPSYHGPVKSKIELLKKYKFVICYENAKGIPGYITEKIFDALAAGCVPIYWGAPNINKFVPENCFINKEKYVSYEDLFQHLSQISESEYNHIQSNILFYLKSPLHLLFTPQFNAKIVVDGILQP